MSIKYACSTANRINKDNLIKLDEIQVKLEDPKSPDNVNWYKVTDDGDVLLDDSDSISIERAKGWKFRFIDHF